MTSYEINSGGQKLKDGFEFSLPSFSCKLVLTATAWRVIIAFGCKSLIFPTHELRLKTAANSFGN